MGSPDVAAYLGLALSDLTEQQIIDAALGSLVARFPDYVPRSTNTEVALLEAQAAALADLVFTINRLPDSVTEVLLRFFGEARDVGAPAAASVSVTVIDTAGYTVPAGTVLRLPLAGDLEPLDLLLAADVVIPPGQTTGTGTAVAASPSPIANGTPSGTVLQIVDALAFLVSAVTTSPVYGGRDAEDGAAFLDRAIPTLSRLTSTLVRPEDFEAALATDPTIARVRALDLYDPTAAVPAVGGNPGAVTVAVAAPGGVTIAAGERSRLTAILRARSHAGLKVAVIGATVTDVDVAVTVTRFAASTAEQVTANVDAAVRALLDPDVWPWSTLVRVNDLIAAVDGAAGVDAVISVTSPASDLTLAGPAPLARARTVTVTVLDPA